MENINGMAMLINNTKGNNALHEDMLRKRGVENPGAVLREMSESNTWRVGRKIGKPVGNDKLTQLEKWERRYPKEAAVEIER